MTKPHQTRRLTPNRFNERHITDRIDVNKDQHLQLDANRSALDLRFMSAIIGFLGEHPLAPGTTLTDSLQRHSGTLVRHAVEHPQVARCQ